MQVPELRKALIERARINELPSVQPHPKVYPHDMYCSGSRYKPIGDPNNCSGCERRFKRALQGLD